MSAINTVDSKLYLEKLKGLLKTGGKRGDLHQTIVDIPFHNRAMAGQLGLGITVLLLVNKAGTTIDRIALAKTDLAQGAVDMSAKPFKEIKIPVNDKNNYIAIAIRRHCYMMTSDWQYLFVPALTPQEARFNQSGAGIACSTVYPLEGVAQGGALIFSYYEPLDKIGKAHHAFMRAYTKLVSEALKSSNNY